MLGLKAVATLAAAAALVHKAAAKAVFAHYMVGTVTQEHAQKDIDDAKALGFDGFALNIGDATQSFVSDTLSYMFPYAESVGFKLYVSMDVYASGDACYKKKTSCKGPFDYQWIWDGYKGSSAYYQVDGKALISTFSSGGFHDTNWTEWKDGLANDMFFMPDFDETDGYYKAADAWWDYWGDVVDGIFSWETAWPARKGYGGLTAGDVSVDMLPMAGAHNRSKPYMMGLSPLQYKNAYGTNVYRQGDLNLVKRMENILQMDPQPDYVQFITWNDGPESHYIGNLWVEQNNDTQPWFYANQEFWSHTAWQPLVASFIDAYKNGKKPTKMTPQSGQVTGAMWYKTILVDSVDCGYESAGQFYEKPDGFENGADDVWWSIILSPDAGTGWKYIVSGEEDHENVLSPGFNWGSSAGKVAGAQKLQVINPSGEVVMSATGGLCVDSGCPNLIYNSNYQVIGLEDGDNAKKCTAISDAEDTSCDGSGCKSTVFDGNGPSAWRNIDCTWFSVENASIDAATRWNTIFTESAWTDLNQYWLSNPHQGGLNYSNEARPIFWEIISNLVHGPEHMDCSKMADSVGCDDFVECNDVNHPAGYFILNGYVSIHNVPSLLCPVSTFFCLTLHTVLLEYTHCTNKTLTKIPFYADNPLQLSNLKDVTNALVGNGVTIIKDVIATEDTHLRTQFLTSSAVVLFWYSTIDSMNESLFNGTSASIDILHSLMTDGKLLETSFDVPSDQDITRIIEKAIFGLLIPLTWTLSPDTYNAVVVDSQSTCDKSNPLSTYISSSVAKSGYVCYNNNIYYLVDVVSLESSCESNSQGGQLCRDPDVRKLPGISALDGSSWGGVTVEDLVVGAVNTWTQMGNTSAFLDPSDIGALDDIYDQGIRSAGVVHIPVGTISELKKEID
ncbi:hypothetical protein BO78DRAFT_304565 [Aspergillus sclerotiicarbonarius CBS 121057]|uniref:Glucan endo-1,3-alpha-glucosidase agn1 n=1 Tax=Aspergillus sclerotiicarbonarius (strain CBS 121057 / IBT 28362) TaxID=1448318 RepID=A0A319EMT6_ASPSB|nr:hypothetical protein BO78DRAFT_304565 [Aspergillus sclerotiicarbonarius CBS 121057]